MDDQFSEARTNPVTPEIPPSAASVAPPPKPELSEVVMGHLMRFGVSLLILAGIWVVAAVVLRAGFLFNFQTRDALGFATIITLVSFFFLRTLIPGLSAKKQTAHTPAQPTDSAREVVETVVFVVVLVLLLKSFAAEAFVIPTGSMAQTLWGYQKVVKCPQCEIEFPVNCSNEVDPTDSPPFVIDSCRCPNCRQAIKLTQSADQPTSKPGVIRDPSWHSGDRVLVAKFVYDLLDRLPERLDVVVFKFPGDANFPVSGPIKKHVPINYIKRLIGRPGETIGIHRGKLFVMSPEKAAEKGLLYHDVAEAGDDPAKKAMLWELKYTHHNDAVRNFEDGDFTIVRKKPENLLSMRRIVYDNDHQAKDLADQPEYQRWRPNDNAAWKPSADKHSFAHDGSGNGSAVEWLHYNHVLRGSQGKPQLVTDVMGYNSGNTSPSRPGSGEDPPRIGNWASDLMVECQVDVAAPSGTLALEISRGPCRYQALFDLAKGTCTLYQVGREEAQAGDFAEDAKATVKELQTAATSMTKKGTYHLRFANMDDRLAVWVDEHLVFGDGVELSSPSKLLPTVENDLERPASIGSRQAQVAVSKIKVYRDTYYTLGTRNPNEPDCDSFRPDEPKTWPDLAKVTASTYYVQPGHFLCLGDNSPQSSDGRSWGTVPQRLLLGRALLVYYPFTRAGRIR